jgi:hypothetical protein
MTRQEMLDQLRANNFPESDRKATQARIHREYYKQYVTEGTKASILREFGNSAVLTRSTDPAFNDIDISRWDKLARGVLYHNDVKALMEANGDYLTIANAVSILKETARQMVR